MAGKIAACLPRDGSFLSISVHGRPINDAAPRGAVTPLFCLRRAGPDCIGFARCRFGRQRVRWARGGNLRIQGIDGTSRWQGVV